MTTRDFAHPESHCITVSGVLAALGDPVRLSIMNQLVNESGEIAWGRFEVSVGKATLSHHMKTLRHAGLILHRKEGTRCFVTLRCDVEEKFPGLLPTILNASKDEQRRAQLPI